MWITKWSEYKLANHKFVSEYAPDIPSVSNQDTALLFYGLFNMILFKLVAYYAVHLSSDWYICEAHESNLDAISVLGRKHIL